MNYITQEDALKLYSAAEEEAPKLLGCVGEYHPDLWKVEHHLLCNAAIAHYLEAQPANEWKEAVINELVVAHILTAEHETNPRKAVQDAITWNCQVALDPAVSADAQALIDRGMAQPAKPVEPEGFVLVPIEPTLDMLATGDAVWVDSARVLGCIATKSLYKAMLAAAAKERT